MSSVQQHQLHELRRLARLFDVETSYTDLSGREIEAGADSMLAVLRGLGAPLARIEDAGEALRQRELETWHHRLEPVIVAWDGALRSLELRLPIGEAKGTIEVAIEFEGGGTRAWRLAADAARVRETRAIGGDEYVALSLALDAELPSGYHELSLREAGQDLRSLVISAPMLAYRAAAGRRWGVFLPLYALHSKRSWGIGDFTDLGAMVEWAAGEGASFVATLPLQSSFLETPFEPSPYVPVSRLFWNEIFIDPEAAVMALEGPFKQDDVVPAATVEAARRLNAGEQVPFREAMTLKRRVLEQLTRLYFQNPANEAGRGLRAMRPALQDYAAFRATVERQGPSWRAWPERQRSGSLLPIDYDRKTAEYYAYAQATAGEQMASLARETRERGLRLYVDLPVGVHSDGYDAWRHQDLFVESMSVGAPPDDLAPQGQNWGFRPLNPESQRQDRYEYMRAYLHHHFSAAGILRIDHAIGLHRLFWIPEGAAGKDGVFVRQRHEELYAILSLESHRHEAVLVGENLGLVPPEVNKGLDEHGVAGMYVQQFEFTGNSLQPVKTPKQESIVSFGTHDLPPFAAYWSDSDLDDRQRMGLMDAETAERMALEREREREALASYLQVRGLLEDGASTNEVYRASTRLLAESDAEWAMLNLEDTWGETRSQNVPGTMAEQHPNWTQRARYALERFRTLDDITKAMELMRESRPGEEREEQRGGPA